MENNIFLKNKSLKKTGMLNQILNKELDEIKSIEEKQYNLLQNSIENDKKIQIYKERIVNPPKVNTYT